MTFENNENYNLIHLNNASETLSFVENRKIMGFKVLTVLNNKKLSRSTFGSNFGLLLSKNFHR